MTVQYENTLQDAIAYNEYCHNHTPRLRRYNRRFRFLGPLAIIAGASLTLRLLQGHPLAWWAWIILLLGAAFYFAIHPAVWRFALRKQVKLLSEAGAYKAFIGAYAVTIGADGIRSVASIGEALYRWDAVTSVVKTETHLFLFLSETMAVFIPRRAFADAAQETAFLAEIECYRAGAVAVPAVASAAVTPATQINNAPVSNAPWWSGQTASSVEADAQANVNRREG